VGNDFYKFPQAFYCAQRRVDFALLLWGISTLCLSQVVSRAVRGYAFASSSLGCTVLTTTSNGRSKPSIAQFQQCALPSAYKHTQFCAVMVIMQSRHWRAYNILLCDPNRCIETISWSKGNWAMITVLLVIPILVVVFSNVVFIELIFSSKQRRWYSKIKKIRPCIRP